MCHEEEKQRSLPSPCGILPARTSLGEMSPGDASSMASHCDTADCAAQYPLPFHILKETEDCRTAEENVINAVSYQTHEQRWQAEVRLTYFRARKDCKYQSAESSHDVSVHIIQYQKEIRLYEVKSKICLAQY